MAPEVRMTPIYKNFTEWRSPFQGKFEREVKKLVLQDLRSIETYVKKINDVKGIRNQIERIYPRMIGYLKRINLCPQ